MGFISSLFGGSQQQQQSQSQNVNNGLITSDYGGQVANGTNANNIQSSLLTGTGNTGAANGAYNNYLQQAGYAPAMKQLSQNITGQGAAAGLLDSGSTTKALQSSGAALNNQFYNNYLQQLGGLSSQGTQAGSLIAGTGQQSSSSGSGSNNTGLFGQNSGGGSNLGDIASLFAF